MKMSDRLAGFDGLIAGAMREWKVPGLTITVVDGDTVVHLQAYGTRDPGKGLPMTVDTHYRLASNTKAFTAMALGILVDEGKVAWDTPVRRYVPELRMYDPYATEHLTPRDLLCHRSGLPAHDGARWGKTSTRAEIVGRYAYLEPSCDMRTRLQYNNLMYMLAGHIVERVTGVPYEQFITDRILRPLGMEKSGFSRVRAFRTGDCAECYWQKDGMLRLYRHAEDGDPDEVHAGAPAGGLVSTAREMGPWLIAQVNGGACGGTRIVSAATLAEMHTPQMIDNWPRTFPEMGPSACALGWFTWTYRGHPLVLHGGFFGSQLVMIPSRRVAVAFLPTLGMHSHLYLVACFTVFDRLLGLDPQPWQERFMEQGKKDREKLAADAARARVVPVAGTHPSRPLPAYCGTFSHPAYGVLTIDEDSAGLGIRFNGDERVALRHFHHDTFEMRDEEDDYSVRFTFQADARGGLSTLSAPLEPAVRDIVFARAAV
jgi:CubicO group peptidase (beta-lactamase class C family)